MGRISSSALNSENDVRAARRRLAGGTPVATYVDDTPLFFNLRLQDLDRVESCAARKVRSTARARSVGRSIRAKSSRSKGFRCKKS